MPFLYTLFHLFSSYGHSSSFIVYLAFVFDLNLLHRLELKDIVSSIPSLSLMVDIINRLKMWWMGGDAFLFLQLAALFCENLNDNDRMILGSKFWLSYSSLHSSVVFIFIYPLSLFSFDLRRLLGTWSPSIFSTAE